MKECNQFLEGYDKVLQQVEKARRQKEMQRTLGMGQECSSKNTLMIKDMFPFSIDDQVESCKKRKVLELSKNFFGT